MGDLGGGLFKALAHLHLETRFLDQIGGQMKCLRLTVEHHREEKLAMELLAIGAAAVGLAALPAAFDKRAGQHLTQRAQSTNESAAQVEFRVGCHLPLILMSDQEEVKPFIRLGQYTPNSQQGRSPQLRNPRPATAARLNLEPEVNAEILAALTNRGVSEAAGSWPGGIASFKLERRSARFEETKCTL